ncbi:hypothetical protein U1Q18_033361 [Sarracenia purpurea var. burkii]
MDEPVQGYPYSGTVNLFGFDHILIPTFTDQNIVNGFGFGDPFSDPNHPNPTALTQSYGALPEDSNIGGAVLEYMTQMLMEDEDWENRDGVFQDSLALQAAEKSLYDVLGEKYPPSPNYSPPLIHENPESPDEDFNRICSSYSATANSSATVNSITDSDLIGDRNKFGYSLLESSRVEPNSDGTVQSDSKTHDSSSIFSGTVDSLVSSFQILAPSESQASSQSRRGKGEVTQINYTLNQKEKTPKILDKAEKSGKEHSPSRSRGKKKHYQVDDIYLEAEQSNKLASYDESSNEQSEMYDEVLLSPSLNLHLDKESSACLSDESPWNELGAKPQKNEKPKRSSRGRPRGKKQRNRREMVDLVTLLTQCAQAVARIDTRTSHELLKQIRQHSTPNGDGTERLAHYFANALEARLAGSARASDASLVVNRLSSAETLKAYLAYITASPFKKMSYFFSNKMIWKVAEKATRLHIIDFGIIHGFQWPCLIQHLSKRSSGPPRVRITGIDFPQPGFRPSKRVEETGHRIAYYCQRFNVPFEYNGVAKKWDTIQIEDLKIERDEVLVVNCLYRLRYVPDETVDMNSPRDAVLKLIRGINPDLFIHGIVNGSYNAPFFVTRFREAMFQFHAVFDMFDACLPREDEGRMLYEREILGGGAMSVIACEGTERLIRPETYKQWQNRIVRAGFRQLRLDREIMENVKARVKLGYHKDFVVDEDSNWMLQGWKGRIVVALACWKP